jgi:cytochrome d ubiquinol oxidase subunit II
LIQNPNSFYEGFIAPWFNVFSFLMGGFVCTCFLYIATVYIVGETHKQEAKSGFIGKVGYIFILTVGVGASVLIIGIYKNNPLFLKFLGNYVSLGLILGALLLYIPIKLFLIRKTLLLPRLLVGVQISCVCLAWAFTQFPYIIPISINSDFQGLDLFEAAAGQNTLANLLIALSIGTILIVPSIFYLFRKLKVI